MVNVIYRIASQCHPLVTKQTLTKHNSLSTYFLPHFLIHHEYRNLSRKSQIIAEKMFPFKELLNIFVTS